MRGFITVKVQRHEDGALLLDETVPVPELDSIDRLEKDFVVEAGALQERLRFSFAFDPPLIVQEPQEPSE